MQRQRRIDIQLYKEAAVEKREGKQILFMDEN